MLLQLQNNTKWITLSQILQWKGRNGKKRFLPVVPSSVLNFSPLHYRLYHHWPTARQEIHSRQKNQYRSEKEVLVPSKIKLGRVIVTWSVCQNHGPRPSLLHTSLSNLGHFLAIPHKNNSSRVSLCYSFALYTPCPCFSPWAFPVFFITLTASTVASLNT